MARILVIDDSEHIRHLVRMTLSIRKHEVAEAENGAAGLAALRGGGFDLVICDLDMPVMGGIEFLAQARREHGPAAPPVLILTAETGDVRERALGQGAANILAKPFVATQLLAEVDRLTAG